MDTYAQGSTSGARPWESCSNCRRQTTQIRWQPPWRPKLGMEAPLLAHGVQHPLGEYVRVWRRRALVAMSSPDMTSVFTNN